MVDLARALTASISQRPSLRIGLVIYGDLETLTGGYLYDRKLVEFLRSRGDVVAIFSLPWRNYGTHLFDNLSQRLIRSVSEARLDVLLEDELNHPSLFRLNRRLKAGVTHPVVSIVHHLRCSELRPAWQNKLYRLVERDYLAGVDGFVFNSVTTRRTVENLIRNRKPSVVAFPGRDGVIPGITRASVERRALETGPLRILFVGSLIPRKELHTLLAALARLPRDSWRLDVVGSPKTDPTYASRVSVEIERLGIGGHIQLLGSLTGQQLTDCYSRNHLLAVPSSYEGFGIVYLEAMGFGLPALASTAGAAHEIITHDRDGFLVRAGDADAIARNIGELVSDRGKLVRMGLAALDRYAAHPTWGDSAATVRNFLEEMVH
jgi:glycosyltransferase involved in cell wall biosynthesis